MFGQEAGLDIDLGELGLAVGAQVLVAEALGELVVAIVAGHHQHLFEQLWRLRQRKELAVMHTARHQIVASALGRRLGQHRRLDVDEAGVVEEAAEGARGLVAQLHDALHVGAAQVDDAMRQADGLREVVVVDLERRRGGRVEHFKLVRQHLDLAGDEVGVLGTGRAAAHLAGDAQAELVAYALGSGKGLGAVGVADHLDQALAVAQVDEDDPTVVAAAVGPAKQGDDLVEVGGVDSPAVIGAHGKELYDGLEGLRSPPAGDACGVGETTPIEITYFRASSTLMSSSTASRRGTMMK